MKEKEKELNTSAGKRGKNYLTFISDSRGKSLPRSSRGDTNQNKQAPVCPRGFHSAGGHCTMKMGTTGHVELVATQSSAQNQESLFWPGLEMISLGSVQLFSQFGWHFSSHEWNVLCPPSKNKSRCCISNSGHIKPCFVGCFKESKSIN